MGSFNIINKIKVVNPCANIDFYYGPYNSISDACTSVPSSLRSVGKTVGILESGSVVEYWWKSGTTDADLVQKVAEVVPKLEYTEDFPSGTIIRKEVGETISIKVKFTSSTYGLCTLTINKDGSLFKTVKANKGIITVDLGTALIDGTSTYTVTGVDALTIPASQELLFKVVTGGASMSTDMQSLIDAGLNTSSDITITYNASVADNEKTVKVLALLKQGSTEVVSHTNTGSGETPSALISQEWHMGVISTAGDYTLTFSAYTGAYPGDTSGDNVTKTVTYTFSLLDVDEFKMTSDTTSVSTNTNTVVTIPFRIYAGSPLTLKAHGALYNSSEQVVSGFSLERLVQSNTLSAWSLGKITTAGTYTIRMYATTANGEDTPSGRVTVEISVTVSQYIPSYDIVTTGLISQFLADGKSNLNDADTAGYWRNSVTNSSLYFALNDLNYNTNGWKHVDESIPDTEPTGEMMLKFSGESFGRLKTRRGATPSPSTDDDYEIFTNLRTSESTGFTAEIIFRTRCIGELKTKVMTAHGGSDTNTAGFSASFEKISVGSNNVQPTLEVAEDQWIHATMVIDKTINTNPEDVQDYRPNKLMTLYINGSACAATILTDNMTFTNNGPVILNAAINNITSSVDYFGLCEIKTIRFYNKPLSASEVVQNYIASIYDPTQQATIAGRNEDVLPIVKFVNINATHPQNPLPEGVTLYSFALLNGMTDKAEQKKKYTCARILYRESSTSDEIEWPRAIIQTQGTSTLAFPIKNYKIKLYKDKDSVGNVDDTYTEKNKITTFASKGWEPEYTFTLKCDYMEGSHMNNTPSCEFYNDMIDDLIDAGTIADGWNDEGTVYTAANDERTPSRRDEKFDAIKGFPCLVYYYESEADYISNTGTYVGTYMFNLDKAADSLGFDSPATLSTDGETVTQISNLRKNYTTLYPIYDSTQTYNKKDRCTYNSNVYIAKEDNITGSFDSTKWKDVTTVDNVMQSFEGAANSSGITAGCFYSYEDWKTSFYNTYCEAAYTIHKLDYPTTYKATLAEFIQYYSIDHPTEQYRTSETLPVEYDDEKLLKTKNVYLTAKSPYATEYEYFAADYEVRYDYDDLEEGGEEFWGNSTWGLKRMIDWVSANAASAGTSNDTFKSNFSDYFNLKYCILYYLQMIVYGQVDNAGKNAMWDTWDGLVWLPRPYDLDTMAGLNNTGEEKIYPDAELNRLLSPFKVENSTSVTGVGYSTDTSSIAGRRYTHYNTQTSKFWIAFAKSFAAEINAIYATLRNNGTYTASNIVTKHVAKTSGIIGETYYNRDMANKYYKLSGNVERYIQILHGNRVQKFTDWITKRIVFCDSLFNYTSDTISLNNTISLRSYACTGTPLPINVGIKVYSPQYIIFTVGTNQAIIEGYCSPDATYTDPITSETKEGTLFTIPLTATDKEVIITGSGNIKEIVNIQGLKVGTLTLTTAKKLTSLDISYSTNIIALALGTNTYLQTLDCRDCTQLGTAASGAQLDLSNCVNLKNLYIDKTKLTSIVLPTGGSLKTISAKNTAITAISMNSLHFLTSIDVSGCENILSYAITNCPKLTSVVADNLPLTTVSVTNCKGLQSISLQGDTGITSLTISTCPNISSLNLRNNRSSAVSTLDLTTLYSLSSLDIRGAVVERIKFPLYSSSTSSTLWGSNFTTLLMGGSNIKYIQYGETTTSAVDMGQLTALTSLSFADCGEIEHIENLDYTGNCASLFSNCVKLLDIEGSITSAANTGASSIFSSCLLLNDLSNITFYFTNCTSLASAFYRCPYVKLSEVKKVIDSCGSALTNLNSICYDKDYGVTTTQTSDYTEIPANFFGNCKNVTSMTFGFYSFGITSLPSSAFVDSEGYNGLQSCTNFQGCFSYTKLTGIPTDLMNHIPATNTSGMFEGTTTITTALPSDFFGSSSSTSTLTNIKGMFWGCTGLIVNMSNMADLLAPLSDVTNAEALFYGCTHCTGTIPEGFFAPLAKVTSIAGFFTNTGIQSFPSGAGVGSIFRVGGDTTTDLTHLSNIGGLFAGCSSLSGNVRSGLFAGGSNITTIGVTSIIDPVGSSSRTVNGLFYNTDILQISVNCLTTMPLLQNVSGIFRGCTSLYRQIESATFSGNLLNTHTRLKDVSSLFYGCSNLALNSVPQLFTASKSTITSVSNVFRGCTNFANFDLDMFTNMSNLLDASYAFYGCTSLGTTIDSSFLPFSGCSKLQNVSYAFYGCTGLSTGASGSIPATLFNSCRNTLTNTSYMFGGCSGIDGSIGVGNEDTVSPSSPTYQLGLLAECMNLTTVKGMFEGCTSLIGAIPWDMFYTSSSEYTYSSLKDVSFLFHNCKFGTPTEYNGSNYLFHPDFFSKLNAITTTEGMFKRDYNVTSGWAASYPVYATSFSNLYFITTIKEMFHRCNGLGGSVTNNWFSNSITKITNAYGAFAYTNITDVGTSFLRANTSTANTTLTSVSRMFYGCSSITSALPLCNNSSAFTKIDYSNPNTGYLGYAYSCTNASNIGDFTEPWTRNMNY